MHAKEHKHRSTSLGNVEASAYKKKQVSGYVFLHHFISVIPFPIPIIKLQMSDEHLSPITPVATAENEAPVPQHPSAPEMSDDKDDKGTATGALDPNDDVDLLVAVFKEAPAMMQRCFTAKVKELGERVTASEVIWIRMMSPYRQTLAGQIMAHLEVPENMRIVHSYLQSTHCHIGLRKLTEAEEVALKLKDYVTIPHSNDRCCKVWHFGRYSTFNGECNPVISLDDIRRRRDVTKDVVVPVENEDAIGVTPEAIVSDEKESDGSVDPGKVTASATPDDLDEEALRALFAQYATALPHHMFLVTKYQNLNLPDYYPMLASLSPDVLEWIESSDGTAQVMQRYVAEAALFQPPKLDKFSPSEEKTYVYRWQDESKDWAIMKTFEWPEQGRLEKRWHHNIQTIYIRGDLDA